MPTDPTRIKAIFLEAAELPDDTARAEYLNRACGADTGLRERVEALFRSHDPAGSFLGTPVAVVPDPDFAGTVAFSPTPDHATTRTGGESPSDDEVPLGFLAPATRPDSLGRIGHYEVLQVLGQGGFGIVFRAFDDVLHRVVAVKVLAPQMASTSPARKRFLREARSSAQVRHENVVQVYEVGETPLPYIAMEFIPGETLQDRLKRIGPVDPPEVVRIGRQIAEGLAAAHATDLIHRDIKPGNILLEGGAGRVKITDFGLARAADDASISQSGIIAGTPMYMAPEQAKGEKLDQRADLFSLGSVLYQMAAGRPPFRANSTVAVLKRVAEDTPRDIREIVPEVPQWLCDIIAKLHAKNPDDRYQSAREVSDVLADCEAQLKANSKLKDFSRIPLSKQPTTRKSGSWKWAAAAVVLLPVLALAVTEFAGVTQLFRPQATPNPITPGGDQTPVLVAKQEPLPPTFTNSIGMEFVLVPKGKSWLGGGKDKLGDQEVEIPADFYLGKYEVTQEEWEKVMGENPSEYSRTGIRMDAVKDINDADLKRFPVENVSWDQCQIFVAKLNELEKETGWVYRLPKEVEWEYACRGGPMADKADSAFDFYFAKPTNTLLPERANFDYGLNRTCLVGSYEANRLGLFDMHGNVSEYCDNAVKPDDGALNRVVRGGNWTSNSFSCQAIWRYVGTPSDRNVLNGLRLARVPSGAPSPEAKIPPVTDPDRRAAEYVLSAGGSVRVNDQDRDINAAAELPKTPFQLTGIDLTLKPVTDTELAVFKDCKNLTRLWLPGTSVTDAGLGHFKGCTNLKDINLSNSGRVTDAGLAHFKDCKNLTHINLHDNERVTDAGLAHFKDYKNLMFLGLSNAKNIGDAGLAHFKDCKNLVTLFLYGTKITDEGLAHFTGLDQLTDLHVNLTAVTAKGVEKLAKALPKCKITWDGGVIEPTVAVAPFTDADVKRIAALPAAEQVEEVRKELIKRNPAFDGKVEHKIEDGVVTEFHVLTDNVTDVVPVRALTGLVYLDLRGTYPNKGKLADLSPLKGMRLSRLDCSSTQIADLTPLADVPLTTLHVNHNPVSDLKPLKGMPLEHLGIAETKVSDLSPLKGLKLKTLGAQLLPVTDLSPLEGMPLTGLDLYHTIGVTKLDALKGMPLEGLNLQDVPVKDLAPLKDMSTLRSLQLVATDVSDLSPLAGLKLTDLILSGNQITDLSPLKGLPLKRLHFSGTGVSDLRPLQGMSLDDIRLNPKNITQGLDVLRGMKSLKTIGTEGNKVWPAEEFWQRHDKGEFKE